MKNYIRLLDDFYRQRCNGQWEHRYGITIETCDNPGWLFLLEDDNLDKLCQGKAWNVIAKKISEEHHVRVSYKNAESSHSREVIIFAASLECLLDAAAEMILALFAASSLVSWATGRWLEQEALGMAFAFAGAVVLSCLFKHHCAYRLRPCNAAGKPLIPEEEKKAKKSSRRERRTKKKCTRHP